MSGYPIPHSISSLAYVLVLNAGYPIISWCPRVYLYHSYFLPHVRWSNERRQGHGHGEWQGTWTIMSFSHVSCRVGHWVIVKTKDCEYIVRINLPVGCK